MEMVDVEITMSTEAYKKLCSIQDLYVFIKSPEIVDRQLQELSPGIRPANPKFNAILNGLVIEAMLNHEFVPLAYDDEIETDNDDDFEEYIPPMNLYYTTKDVLDESKGNEVIDITQYMKHK